MKEKKIGRNREGVTGGQDFSSAWVGGQREKEREIERERKKGRKREKGTGVGGVTQFILSAEVIVGIGGASGILTLHVVEDCTLSLVQYRLKKILC